jgi:hypothetical protein
MPEVTSDLATLGGSGWVMTGNVKYDGGDGGSGGGGATAADPVTAPVTVSLIDGAGLTNVGDVTLIPVIGTGGQVSVHSSMATVGRVLGFVPAGSSDHFTVAAAGVDGAVILGAGALGSRMAPGGSIVLVCVSAGTFMVSSGGLGGVVAAGLGSTPVVCTAANTNYAGVTLPLPAAILHPNSMWEVEVGWNWAGLVASTKTMMVGIGRNSTDGLTGNSGNANGALILSRTNGSVNNTADMVMGIQIGSSLSAQAFRRASDGDETAGTNSALPTGSVTLGVGDCNLYIGAKSATAGETINITGWVLRRTG